MFYHALNVLNDDTSNVSNSVNVKVPLHAIVHVQPHGWIFVLSECDASSLYTELHVSANLNHLYMWHLTGMSSLVASIKPNHPLSHRTGLATGRIKREE